MTRSETPAPKPRKRVKSGDDGKGGGFTAGEIAADYLSLCHDPLNNLERWLAEDKKRPSARGRVYQPAKEAKQHAFDTTKAVLGNADGLRRQPLHPVQGGVGSHRERGGQAHGLLGRPGAGVGRHDGLQQVSAEGTGLASRGGESGSYGAEADAISAEFARKLDGLRRRLAKWEIPAAIRALKNDRAVALQALRDKKQGERFAAREITRRAQAGFPPTARPS